MDYEEKYKEALGWMQSLYKGLHGITKEDAEHYFPELKESEDERIRKVLLNDFKNNCSEYYCEGVNRDMIIAWLEKQGVQKNTRKREIDDAYLQGICDAKHEIEKQGEQKTDPCTDCANDKGCVTCVDGNMKETIKSKFKVGDFITNGYCLGKVIVITNDAYLLDIGQGIPFSCKNTHLWTINDARDGDVLTNGEVIVIFKQIVEPKYRQHIEAYIGLDLGCNIQVTSESWSLGIDKTMPATKEQRDLLFEKMKEDGYEWDADKKELKKMEVASKDDDDERIRKAIHIYLDWLDGREAYQPKGVYTIRDMIDWVIKQDKKISADKVIAWLVANICEFDYYVKRFKEDFEL